MERDIRIACIGAGRHSSSKLYPNLHKLTGARVVAACDRDRDRVQRVAGHFGIPATGTDWAAVVDGEGAEAAVVCINDQAHAELAQALLARGIHVFVEKPHAPDLAASRAMLAAARSAGRICMAGYKKRHAPAYVRARELIAEPAFGSVARLAIARTMGGNDQTRPGYLWQWGCHAIDLVDHFLGQPSEICAWRSGDDWRAVSVLMRFAGGAVGELSLSSPGGNWETVQIHGSRMAALRIADGLYLDHYYGNEVVGGLRPAFAASNDGDRLMGFVGELQAFVDAVRSGVQPAGNIADATRTAALWQAIQASLESGGPVPVETVGECLDDLAEVVA